MGIVEVNMSMDDPDLTKLLGISDDDFIVDIGCGHHPLPFADVIVDLEIGKSTHRDGSFMTIPETSAQPVIADLHEMPFNNKVFDWAICRQVLEHVSHPHKACSELMRIAKKGYIEVPRKWTEYYAGHPTHKWIIDLIDDCLVFEPINWTEPPFMNFALHNVWSSPILFANLQKNYHIPCLQLTWNDNFPIQLHKNDRCASTQNTKAQEPLRHFYFARNILYWGEDIETGLIHIEKAFSCCQHKKQFLELYCIYLLQHGQIKKALANRCPVTIFIKATILKATNKIRKWSERIYRSLLTSYY